jgi:dCMP deaminase
MKPKYIHAHMKTAENYASLSTARRLQVGAILVKEDRIISIGYNGMPAGWDNTCEDTFFVAEDRARDHDTMVAEGYTFGTDKDTAGWVKTVTKPQVLHAEANAIAKVARSPESAEGAVLFVTHSPCMECAKLVYQSGIRQVFWGKNYRSEDGLNFLRQAGVTVTQVEE